MTMTAAGVAKLIEECGELQQVLGKKLAMWDQDEHWDSTNLADRMVEEMGDVLAAIELVAGLLQLNRMRIEGRRRDKRLVFDRWQAETGNNEHGIDRDAGIADLVRDHIAERSGHHVPGIDRCPLCWVDMSLHGIADRRAS